MNRCPKHNKPLVRTFGGSDICFVCRAENKRKLFDDPESNRWTVEVSRAKKKERDRNYYHNGKARRATG